MTDSDQTTAEDQWLVSMFAAAAGPFVDSAFAERILSRLRRREQLRLLVIFGTGLIAAILTAWLVNDLSTASQILNFSQIKGPTWLSTSGSAMAAVGALLTALAVWMVAEEA